MDYDSLNYTYVFKNKVERQELKLRPIDDDLVEADETYKLTIVIEAAQHRVHTGENATTTITIYNNDGKQLCNNKNHTVILETFIVKLWQNLMQRILTTETLIKC